MEWMALVDDMVFSQVESGTGLRETLSPLKNSPQFNWLVPVLTSTLDDFVADAFDEDAVASTGVMDGSARLLLRVDKHRYLPFKFEQNLSIANDMINRLLSKRNQIFDLEAEALKTAIGYCEEAQLIPGEEAAASMAGQADAVRAGKPFDGILAKWPALRSRTKREILSAKLAMHNQAGSSLNYGEQVSLMRKIYADNVRILCERMHAVAEFLSLYGITLTGRNAHVADPRSATFVEDSVWWIRHLLEGYEDLERTMERGMGYVDVIQEATRGKTPPEQAEIWNRFLDTGEIEFDLSVVSTGWTEIMQWGGGVVQSASATSRQLPCLWLVGVSAAITVREIPNCPITENAEADRKSLTARENLIAYLGGLCFPVRITPPKQLDHNGSLATVDVGMVPLRVNEPMAEDLRPIEAEGALRFSPLGRWRVSIGPALPDRHIGFVPGLRQTLGAYVPPVSIVIGLHIEHA